jgi:hypothetical protein
MSGTSTSTSRAMILFRCIPSQDFFGAMLIGLAGAALASVATGPGFGSSVGPAIVLVAITYSLLWAKE